MLGTEEWMRENYHIISGRSLMDKRPETIFVCAYRKYDEATGSTGGPGGVLHMLQGCFGSGEVAGMRAHYIYMPQGRVVPENIWRQMEGLDGRIKIIIAAAGYVSTAKEIEKSIGDGENPIFMCHDIGSAYGAYLLRHPYILVYHQQGSIIQEMLSNGVSADEREKEILRYVERKVLMNAVRVYFPSKGAKDVFRESCLLDFEEWEKVSFEESPLYNTADNIKLRGLPPLILPMRKGCDVFVSVGDFVSDKGLDRVPNFLRAYQDISGRKAIWIVVGNALNKGLCRKVHVECEKQGIMAYMLTHRIGHGDLTELIAMADYYIMLHRRAIFDLATLEAMQLGKCVILSDCVGNQEFNVCENVLFVSLDDIHSSIIQMIKKDKNVWRNRSRKAFHDFFGIDMFAGRYAESISKFEEELAGTYCRRDESFVNHDSFKRWKGKFHGKKCVICGSGISLEDVKTQERGCIYIALNKALFYKTLKFDFLFMQDAPKSQEYGLEDFNKYDCVKFYGIINNKNIKVEGLGGADAAYPDSVNEIYRYDLNSSLFDYRCDRFEYELDKFALSDAQSVLFSALQFAVFAGFSSIYMAGIDFGRINYGNISNTSVYASNVARNLIAFKKQLIDERPDVSLKFLATAHQELENAFWEMDCRQRVYVSGIYTGNYREMVMLQEQTCKDDYFFEFQYISDEEWNRNKAEEGFAFFSGNTLKTQLIIDKIKEHWGEVLIVADADLVFFKETKGDLLRQLGRYDMLFLCERSAEQPRYERTPANINIGFVAMNCNEASLGYWESVQNEVVMTKGWDQEVANLIIAEGRSSLKYSILADTEYLNGGGITDKNLNSQRICTACGSVAEKWGGDKLFFLKEAYTKYYDGKWFY